MENAIGERLMQIMSTKKVTKQNLANEINMNQTTVGRQLKGEQALSAKLLEGILNTFPDISAEWLLRGEGEMYRTKDEHEVEINLSGGNNTLMPSQEDSIWKAKYEAIKECYDTLVATLGGGLNKINKNVG